MKFLSPSSVNLLISSSLKNYFKNLKIYSCDEGGSLISKCLSFRIYADILWYLASSDLFLKVAPYLKAKGFTKALVTVPKATLFKLVGKHASIDECFTKFLGLGIEG